MEYTWRYSVNHYEVIDEFGRFVCSADNRKDAEHEIDILEAAEIKKTSEEMTYVFSLSCLVAKARWITKGGETLQVPVEEFHRLFIKVAAPNLKAAILTYEKPGFIYREWRVESRRASDCE